MTLGQILPPNQHDHVGTALLCDVDQMLFRRTDPTSSRTCSGSSCGA
jgi:hypothetical protein